MTRTRNPIRLLFEILLVVAVAQAAVMAVLPAITSGLSGRGQALISAALLVLLAGPTVYWRCMVISARPWAPSSGKSARSGSVGSAIAVTAAAQALGLALTVVFALWQQRTITAAGKERFEGGATRIEAEARRQFAMPLYGLNGLRGLFAANGEVSRDQFRAWVESLNLSAELPGVRGFGFIERVDREDLSRFILRAQTDGAPKFAVTTSGDASTLYVVKYIEPIASTGAALGLDVGREAVRREAAERAVASGMPALSGPVTLAQGGYKDTGFLYFVPVYRGGIVPASAQQRQTNLVGLLYAPIVAAQIMQRVTTVAARRLEVELFDHAAPLHSELLFDSRLSVAPEAPSQPASQPIPPLFESLRHVEVGGRVLALRVRSGAAFEASIDRSSVAFVAVGGVLASFLMALAVWLLAVGRVRAQRRALRMTADLARLARVAQHTSNSVAITDPQLRITWVNEGFTRISGYTLEEAVGKMPGELLSSGMADPLALKALLDSAAAGRTCRVEILNRAKDGRLYWIDTEVQPTRDEDGTLVGFMEMGSDITAQKSTHLRLEAAMRETDALLRTVHRHAIVSVADSKGQIVEVNDAFCRISGYSREELLGQDHRIVNSGVQQRAFWLEMWKTISGGAPWRGEICNRAKDGTLYWVDSMIAPFAGPQGAIERYVSIRTDISANKAAQQRLSEMTDRLTLAIEGGTDGLWDWVDVKAPEAWLSPSFYTMLGYDNGGFPGSIDHFMSLLHPSHLQACRQGVSGALEARKSFDMELLVRTQSGAYRWYRLRAGVYLDAAGEATRMSGSMQDVHDRKQAERDLGRERQRLGQILEGTNVGTWEWNIETGETHFNERWAQISGYTLEDLAPTTIQTWTNQTHQDDRTRSAVALEQHFNGELPYYESESRAQHKEGHWVWVLDRGKLFSRSGDGRPRWMAGTRMDITQRKQAEQALRESEGFLDRAGRISGVGGWLVDLVTGGITWSDQTCRIHEVACGHRPSLEEAIRYYAPEARPTIERAVLSGIEHGSPWDLELPLITAQGRPIWVRAVGEAEFEGGKPVRLVGAFQDITERRSLNEELRQSNQLMAGVLENLPCGLSVFDEQLKLVAHNSQFRRLLDLPQALFEPSGSAFDRFVRFSVERGDYGREEGQDAGTQALVSAIVQRARHPDVHSFELMPPEGDPLEIRRAPLPGGGFVTTYTDISTRKQAEVLMQEALAQAQQASVAKSQFLANMSHEIRTPMNAILGMLSLLQKTSLTTQQFDYASKTEGAARSLLGLLNDILDFSKAEAGKMKLDPRPFGVERLLRDLSVILSANTGAKPIDVLFKIDPDVPACLYGDDLRLQQILINLGGNAIKFTNQGEVVVSVKVVERGTSDVLLRIAVHDSGIGIAPEHQTHIFSGFSQAEASTTRRFGGTGLGLAICKRLVGMMGGELGLQSAPGQGSIFYFELRLPIVEAFEEDQGAPPAAPLGALRTLIVDDNATAREVFFAMAQSLGWSVDVVASGAEAIELATTRAAENRPFEAIFMDWQMPGLDGWEACERILQMTRATGRPAPMLIMITGHGRETLAERSPQEQAILSGFLVKPVTASMLLDVVSQARTALDHPERLNRVSAKTTTRLAGMRLLVVEDNPNNQQVAQELLSDEGAWVELASNGQLGVDAVAGACPQFDAVLMDVQMPVMDGYTATAQIRDRLGLARLPIIAMTANAMASDREACLAAGMNDHVGKPFDLAHLVTTILRHTGRAQASAAPLESVTVALPSGLVEEADRRGIDLASALGRMGGNSRVYLRTLTSFVEALRTVPDQLAACLHQGRHREAGQLMHTYKGLAATLGIKRLASLAAEAERRLNGAEASARLSALFEELSALVATTLEDISDIACRLEGSLPEAPALTTRPVGPGTAQAPSGEHLLDELAALLRSADMRALEVFERLQKVPAMHAEEALQALDDAMASLDFDQALEHCATLKGRIFK